MTYRVFSESENFILVTSSWDEAYSFIELLVRFEHRPCLEIKSAKSTVILAG